MSYWFTCDSVRFCAFKHQSRTNGVKGTNSAVIFTPGWRWKVPFGKSLVGSLSRVIITDLKNMADYRIANTEGTRKGENEDKTTATTR